MRKLTKTERNASVLIVNNVENYRRAAKSRNEVDHKLGHYHSPEAAKGAFRMQMDRASGALDALHVLFPLLPAWTETKWIH